jgi:gamma-glutamyl:cysteine ligase YbdK (ATP-grasp superfamily)
LSKHANFIAAANGDDVAVKDWVQTVSTAISRRARSAAKSG